jgi:hypothetical protein
MRRQPEVSQRKRTYMDIREFIDFDVAIRKKL